MKLYELPMFIGFSIMILSFLPIFGAQGLVPTYIVSLSFAGFFFSFAGMNEDYLDAIEGVDLNKCKVNRIEKIITSKQFIKKLIKTCYFLAIFFVVAMPIILENFKILDELKMVGDSVTIFSIGIIIASMGLREITKKRIQTKRIMNIVKEQKDLDVKKE